VAAVARIVAGDNENVKRELLPGLLTAQKFATVGISHLTTSHRHLARPVLRAEPSDDGFILDGFSPWVTGALYADILVLGATLDDGRQLLVALDTNSPGVEIAPPEKLVALSASQTGRVDCHQVNVPHERVIAGPVENVMQRGLNAGTGGLTTSTLAIGTADRGLRLLEAEASRRSELNTPADALRNEWHQLRDDLLRLANNEPACTTESLRQRANSLVLRATEAALAAAKGAGYVAGHPAGRLCREALFFLVWSCPQPVTTAHLCELAGLGN
jgi:alkylation response protein AidB-like acyl-CoA dehydrogenase